jgi:hypothetical protein
MKKTMRPPDDQFLDEFASLLWEAFKSESEANTEIIGGVRFRVLKKEGYARYCAVTRERAGERPSDQRAPARIAGR